MRAILRKDLREQGLIPPTNRPNVERQIDWAKSYECFWPKSKFWGDEEFSVLLYINSKIEWVRVNSIDFDYFEEEGEDE